MQNFDKKATFKISLCHSISLNQPFVIDNNNPIFKLISSFDELKYILENKKENIFKFLYFNKNKIHPILYDLEKNITIKSDILENNNLSYYFYLDSLLNSDTNTVNYGYSIEEIKTVNNQIENEKDNEIIKLIKSKLVFSLIINYKQLDDYDEETQGKELEAIEKKIKTKINDIYMNKLKGLKLILEENIIKNENIINIYIVIINSLIKNLEKYENYENYNKLMKLIDLENIDIIKSIYDELYKMLDINNNKDIKKYKISDINDLLNEKTINFYFILFKFILKNTIYIYQISLLIESRKNILIIIKNNLKEIYNTYINGNNTKFKYIIDFFTDSKYYEKYINSYIFIQQQNKQIKSVKKNDLSVSSKISKGVISTKTKTKNLNISIDIEDLQILKYENEITLPKKEYNYLTFIKELNNEYYIIGAPNDILYIYDKNYNYKKTINFKVSKEDLDKFSTQLNTKKIIENENKKGNNQGNNNEIKIIFYIRNIIETNNSKEKNKLEINICSKLVFSKYSFDFSNNNNKLNYSKTIFIPVNGYFEINIDKNNNYILYGEKGLFHLDKNPFNCRISTIDNMGKYQKDKNERNYRGGIQLNNNLIALTSNKVYPNGEDIIIFYDTKNEKIINKCPGYSFVNNINGLVFIQLEQNKNILLCACKKYKNGQQNGILLINADIKENEKINQKFFDTEEFEVNCFCLIQQIKSGKKYKNNFFLVGGLDAEKNVGIIKLYKINETDMDIEFLEDFIDNGHNGHFEGTINCILQSQQDGKILVCCWDNKIYIYSKPNIDLYLDE